MIRDDTAYLQYLVDTYGEAIQIAAEKEKGLNMPTWYGQLKCPNCGSIVTRIEYKDRRLDVMPRSDDLPSYERYKARIKHGEQVFNRGRGSRG